MVGLVVELRRLAKQVWYNTFSMETDYRLEPSPQGVVIRFKKRKDAEEYRKFVKKSKLTEKSTRLSIVKTTYEDGYIYSEETIA